VRVVADTNIIVSAFLWGGVPRQLLDAAEQKRIELFTSQALVVELEDVFSRTKFTEQLKLTRFGPAYLIARYTQFAAIIVPADLHATELRDPDDVHVLACAIAARADLIVSGDDDLVALKEFQGIPIVTAAEALRRLPQP
jgi:putative PIN family toxin of toxin-antitoxin system